MISKIYKYFQNIDWDIVASVTMADEKPMSRFFARPRSVSERETGC